jgi:hypothetical protein
VPGRRHRPTLILVARLDDFGRRIVKGGCRFPGQLVEQKDSGTHGAGDELLPALTACLVTPSATERASVWAKSKKAAARRHGKTWRMLRRGRDLNPPKTLDSRRFATIRVRKRIRQQA